MSKWRGILSAAPHLSIMRSPGINGLTEEQKADLIAEYKSGKSFAVLVKKYKAAQTNIKKLLVENNVPIRSLSESSAARKLPKSKWPEVKRLYEEGYSSAKIDEMLGLSEKSIRYALRQQGVKIRKAVEYANNPKYKLTAAQREEVAHRYAKGESSCLLAKEFGVSSGNIRSLAFKRGVAEKKPSVSNKLTIVQREEAVRRYNEGESAVALGKEFGIHATNVCALVKRRGGVIRAVKYQFTEEELARIRDLYQQGFGTTAIGKELGVTHTIVYGRLKDLGEIRHRVKPTTQEAGQLVERYVKGESAAQISASTSLPYGLVQGVLRAEGKNRIKIPIFTEETSANICTRYKNGETLTAIRKSFKTSDSRIKAILEEAGIPFRSLSESARLGLSNPVTRQKMREGLLRLREERPELRIQHSARMQGIPIEEWAGFKTSEQEAARKSAEYREWRNAVYKRDNYTCQKCEQWGGRLNAHHILRFVNHPELRLSLSNGITLCKVCHESIHGKEKEYAPFFLQVVEAQFQN